jgi:Domain of unknown function (DUF6916)
MLKKTKSSDFTPHLNTEFQLHNQKMQKSVRAELSEVELHDSSEAPKTGAAGSQRPFSLLFRADKDTDLPQGTYNVEHPKLGKIDLFLVPVGMRTEYARYEAVFNFAPAGSKRIIKKTSTKKKKIAAKKKTTSKKVTKKKAAAKKTTAKKNASKKTAAKRKTAKKATSKKKTASK